MWWKWKPPGRNRALAGPPASFVATRERTVGASSLFSDEPGGSKAERGCLRFMDERLEKVMGALGSTETTKDKGRRRCVA